MVVAACEYGLDIYKNWLFASSYTEFVSLAKTCSHAANSHRSIAGARSPDGAFLSKQSAEYPPMLASSIAEVLAPLISAGPELHSVSMAMDQVRVKEAFDPPLLMKMEGVVFQNQIGVSHHLMLITCSNPSVMNFSLHCSIMICQKGF